MKHFLLIAAFLLTNAISILPVSAQKRDGKSQNAYTQLWKEVEAARNKDLPRTACNKVAEIIRLARAEGNDAQLLRAMLTEKNYLRRISPDSALAVLERAERVLARKQASDEKAVWHAALAKSWAEEVENSYSRPRRYYGTQVDDKLQQAEEQSRAHYRAMAQSAELLAGIPLSRYAPLFNVQKDSRHFGSDILHVAANDFFACHLLPAPEKESFVGHLVSIYEQRGNNAAALLLSVEREKMKEKPNAAYQPLNERAKVFAERRNAYQAIAKRYAGAETEADAYIALLERCGELTQYHATNQEAEEERMVSELLAIARRSLERFAKSPRAAYFTNYVNNREQPNLQTSDFPTVAYPGTSHTFALHHCNVAEADMRLIRLNLSASEYDKLRYEDTRNLRKFHGATVSDRHSVFSEAPAYAWRTDSLTLTMPEQPGLYSLELLNKGKVIDRQVVHVSRLRLMQLQTGENKLRLVAVDGMSGVPLEGVSLLEFSVDNENRRTQLRKLPLSSEGTEISTADRRHSIVSYLHTATDNALPAFRLFGGHLQHVLDLEHLRTDLFFDRSIYRPGQGIEVGGVIYQRHHDDFSTPGNVAMTLRLYASRDRNRIIDSIVVKTDRFGAFGGRLQLKEGCLPGHYFVEALVNGHDNESKGIRYFKVEEYKRPTFLVAMEPVSKGYAAGDSVTLRGTVRTYTDLPVPGAKVAWKMSRHSWYRMSSLPFTPVEGTIVSDDEGRFSVTVKLPPLEAGGSVPLHYFRLFYEVQFDATAANGETASGHTSLAVASSPYEISINVPQRLCKEKPVPFTATLRNASAQLVEANGTYRLLAPNGKVLANGTLASGKDVSCEPWCRFASGAYRLEVVFQENGNPMAADTASVVLFSESDTRPATPTPLWVYESGTEGDTRLHIGSSFSQVTLFFDIVCQGRVLHSERRTLTDTLFQIPLPYREAYGEGAVACFGFLKEDKLYSHIVNIARPVPDKTLKLSWSSFRSRLTPGQQEEWRLRISRADGTPVEASLLARLYDASLNVFGRSELGFSATGIIRHVYHPGWQWQDFTARRSAMGGLVNPSKMLKYRSLRFSEWSGDVFSPFYELSEVRFDAVSYSSKQMRANKGAGEMKVMAKAELAGVANAEGEQGEVTMEETVNEAVAPPVVQPRTNFAETAFFFPSLASSPEGEVALRFTLPESLTEWQFDAIAHTQQMHVGTLSTTVLARKDFMIQPALPRFLRQGDRAVIPATLRNLSKQAVKARVRLELVDAETRETLFDKTVKAKVGAEGEATFRFDYVAIHNVRALICRVTADGDGFSDGEEHLLPVFENVTEVTRTLPFSLTKKGTRTLSLDTLWQPGSTRRSLTVEATSSPLWYAVGALPNLFANEAVSADQWAERFYALALSHHLAALHPEIKQQAEQATQAMHTTGLLKNAETADDTPWLDNLDREAARARQLTSLFDNDRNTARRMGAADRLKELQTPEGGWSWFRGMPANRFISVTVATLLARVEALTQCNETKAMLNKAMEYLDTEAAKEVANMKKVEKKYKAELHAPEWLLRYVYLRAVRGMQPNADVDYLLDKAEKQTLSLTIYGKGIMAVAMGKAGRQAAARLQLRGVVEHTVADPEIGRYFDTQRALGGYASYRIPSQVATIEALRTLQPESKEESEMTLWLLQSKRTQAWESSVATTDAVYALLTAGNARLAPKHPPLRLTLKQKGNIIDVNSDNEVQGKQTAGYIRKEYTEAPATEATALTLHKAHEGLSWGAVYAEYVLPVKEVKAYSRGLSVACRHEVVKDGKWQPVASTDNLAPGTRLRRVFTVTADRDFDFVELRSERAANLDPVAPLSGYGTSGSLSFYRIVRDNHTSYFIEHLTKGSRQFAEEYRIDREGCYSQGITTIASVFAPEFRGTAGK